MTLTLAVGSEIPVGGSSGLFVY